MDVKSTLRAELSALQVKLSSLIEAAKSSGRDLTDREAATIEQGSDRAIEIKAQLNAIERGEKGAEHMRRVADLGAGDQGFDPGPNGREHVETGVAGAKGFITPASIKRMVASTTAQGAKAFVAGGSSVTPVALDTDPISLARPVANLGLLGVLPVVTRSTPTYSYLRQTVRTNNAAVVAAGAQKPTSVLTVEEVTTTLDVVAHLSEYVDTYLLADNANLESFIDGELRDGIFTKVTALAVAAFAGTSGIQTQAFSTNVMDSIYLGASKAADLGYNPDVVLLTRAVYDGIMLAKDADGNYLYRNPEDSRLNGLTPIVATGLPTNSALVLDSSKVGISVDRQGVTTKWDAISKIDYNQVRALTEGRFAFDVLAAPAIVKVATVGA